MKRGFRVSACSGNRTSVSQDEQAKSTILVVEDEWFTRLEIMEFLEAHRYRVIEARDGEAATEVLREEVGLDAVVTDIRLHGAMDGWDVAEMARRSHPKIPVVYTSGAAAASERLVSGSVFLRKPYQLDGLLDACRKLCEAKNRLG
jgi:CheY-like chemotaxis protein